MDVLIEAAKEPLKLTLRIGDHTCYKCDTLVTYVLPGTIDESCKLTFHDKDDDTRTKVMASLNQLDSELRAWSIYKVSSSPFPCSELIFIALPAWQGNHDKSLSSRINQSLFEAVRGTSRMANITFASFSTVPFNYPPDFYAYHIVSFLTDGSVFLNEGQGETFSITLFTEHAEHKLMFEEQLMCFGFQLDQSTPKQPSAQVTTLESPDYKAFLNQLYDDIHVSIYIYRHTYASKNSIAFIPIM